MSAGNDRPPWIIRTYAGFADAEVTNKRFLENLRNGQDGLSVAFDLPTQNGYDPDSKMARGEVGACGVSIAHRGDMERLFREIDLGGVNVSMTINATAPFVLALYLVVAEERNIPWNALRGTVQNDLLKEFVARGTSIFDPDVSLRLSTDLITFSAEHLPLWNPINVCGYHYMESGARPHEEIGYAVANALMILDTVRPRVSKEQFEAVVRRISFFINSGIELIPEICKMRAYAQLWTRLCQEQFGITNVRFRAGCQVRSLSLPAQQPENNIVRIVLEALPAILSANARVNALQLPGFREAINLPDQVEQTLSIRTQQILMHETKITEYADIFDGNPVIMQLTDKMVKEAETLALSLRSSGYASSISTIDRMLTEALLDRQQSIEQKDEIVVGVNEFRETVGLNEQLSPAIPTAQDKSFERMRSVEINHWKSARDNSCWEAAREQLRNAVARRENIMPACIEFARSRGTVGEWTNIIETETSGRYTVKPSLRNVGKSNTYPLKGDRPIRIVLGKTTLDGHTNGLKLLAMACRDAGMEVVYAGTKLPPQTLVQAAIEEDADILAVSSLSGAHMYIAHEILELRKQLGLTRLKFAIGGIIPEQDQRSLLSMGVDLVVSNSTHCLAEIVESMKTVAATHK